MYEETSGFVIEDGVLLSYNGSEEKVVIPKEVKEIAKLAFKENKTAKRVLICGFGE
ncbi:MAG: hypothetical protein IJV00_10605 [Clostridia bacterium]|nr:hypothetical protein [Clostridia bacterium]